MATDRNKISEMTENSKFLKDVEHGLHQNPKTLASKYFYDEIGDRLFQDIMAMPEYYLTNCEAEIFQKQTKEIISSFEIQKNISFELIELGAGDGSKTQHLLKELLDQNYTFTYLPVDISQNALQSLESRISKLMPDLDIETKQGEYFLVLEELFNDPKPKIVLFIGSNLGNMEDEVSENFTAKLAQELQPKDKLLLGLDLIKSKDVVLPAYHDAAGITSDFNLNLLHRINVELGADFDINSFSHEPEYTEMDGIAKSFLKSEKDQSVHFKSSGVSFSFKKDEKILTEISRKYNDEVLKGILNNSNLEIKNKFTDSKGYFADYILEKK